MCRPRMRFPCQVSAVGRGMYSRRYERFHPRAHQSRANPPRLPSTRPRTRCSPASARRSARERILAGPTSGSPAPVIHRFRTEPSPRSPIAPAFVATRAPGPSRASSAIDSRSFWFEAGVRRRASMRRYRNVVAASFPPTEPAPTDTPIACPALSRSILRIQRARTTFTSFAALTPAAVSASSRDDRARRRTLPRSVHPKHARTRTCDPTPSAPTAIVRQPLRVARWSCTSCPVPSGSTVIVAPRQDPAASVRVLSARVTVAGPASPAVAVEVSTQTTPTSASTSAAGRRGRRGAAGLVSEAPEPARRIWLGASPQATAAPDARRGTGRTLDLGPLTLLTGRDLRCSRPAGRSVWAAGDRDRPADRGSRHRMDRT